MWCPFENRQLQSWLWLLTVLHPYELHQSFESPVTRRTLSGGEQWIRCCRADITSLHNWLNVQIHHFQSTLNKFSKKQISGSAAGVRYRFQSDHTESVWWATGDYGPSCPQHTIEANVCSPILATYFCPSVYCQIRALKTTNNIKCIVKCILKNPLCIKFIWRTSVTATQVCDMWPTSHIHLQRRSDLSFPAAAEWCC